LDPGFELQDLDFAPGTRNLFLLVKRTSDNWIFPVQAPDVVTG
jgi:hypothetical protein